MKNISFTHLHKHLKTYLYSLLSIISLTGGAYLFNESFSARQWDISASASIKADIEHYLNHADNLDFWHSRPAYLRQQLLNHIPDLADIHIQRQLPDRLVIHVTPRQAIALWQQEQGELYLVDQEGVAYRARKRGESSNLPVLRMHRPQIKAACKLLATLHTQQPRWFQNSSELIAERDGWKLNLSHGQQWKLPFGQHALRNVIKISQILAQPRWHANHWRINTRFENRWYLRPATYEGVI